MQKRKSMAKFSPECGKCSQTTNPKFFFESFFFVFIAHCIDTGGSRPLENS